MATSLTHRYIPRIEQTEKNLFIEEYYSSTDTKIYMDDMEQSEIAYINYSLQEQLKPIYGYASRTFDDVAVGNRIVTGMFKVTVKNPESQSSMSTIIDRSNNSTLEDYNDNQQELMNAIEWITEGKNNNTVSTVIQEDDETFAYRTKLINLGYDLDYNSSAYVLEQQIKKFQSEHEELEVNGMLTISTKNKIDEMLNNSSLSTITVPIGTYIYMSPMFSSDKIQITEEQDIYILDEFSYDDGWVHVMTKYGEEGYINTMEVL